MSYPLLKVGCCGFPLAKAKYAAVFPAVEVQQTFYQPPRIGTLQRWRAEAPADFEFTIKAWQLITHSPTSPTYRRVTTELNAAERNDCGAFQPTSIVHEAWLTTRASAEALGARCVLFQCPASFTPTEQNITNLRQFFSGLERHGLTLVWEPRGAWSDPLLASLCRDLDLVHAVDPFIRPTVTRDLVYYRLHGGQDYRHRFTDRELQQLPVVTPVSRPAYILFNNVSMFEDAVRFQELLISGVIREVA